MMLLRQLLVVKIIFGYFLIVEATFYKNNLTDYSRCTTYYSRSGSVYRDFFKLSERAQPQGNGTLVLDFHFAVLGFSDAHILLAPSSQLEKGDPAYEVVIGAGGNTFCDIRRMQKAAVKESVRISGLLSGLDVRAFWLHMTRDGVIELGREGEELAFLTWTDPDPLPLTVFSLSTWTGVEAKWFFDCPRSDDNSTSHSMELSRNLTDLERLRRDLLVHYDPYVRPVMNLSRITVVEMKLRTKLVTLDEHRSTMQFIGKTSLQWMDEKLIWSPANYSGITKLHIFRREIWIPNLHLFNSVGQSDDFLEDSLLVVNATGHVSWTATMNSVSWCNINDMGAWPRDVHACEMLFSFWRDLQDLQLVFDVNGSIFDYSVFSEWKILQVESMSNKGWAPTNQTTRQFDPAVLKLQLYLKRNSNAYNVILLTPFYVIATALLLSFWVSPFGYLKISLGCLQLVMSSIALIALGIVIPVHSKCVPNLVLLYSSSLIASSISIIIAIIVINLTRNERNFGLPNVLVKVLTSNCFKIAFALPNITRCDMLYNNLNEKTTNLNENNQGWILLGVFIDRMGFLIFLPLTIYAFSITY